MPRFRTAIIVFAFGSLLVIIAGDLPVTYQRLWEVYTDTLPRYSGPVHTIVVDAGHGGHDPGAMHNELLEKDLALDVATRLSELLSLDGFNVVMTRTNDTFMPLYERANIANRIPADLFVSIHINAHTEEFVSGAEVYFPSVTTAKLKEETLEEGNQSIREKSSRIFKRILFDSVLRHMRKQARSLANDTCATMKHELELDCRNKPARFVVLKETLMPAILVEVGYLSNEAEAGKLNTDSYRQLAAESISKGIARYSHRLGPIE